MNQTLARLIVACFFLLVFTCEGWSQGCECRPGTEHLCRCSVLIDQQMAERQLAYLSRLMLAEFGEHLVELPLTEIRLGSQRALMFRGVDSHGMISGSQITVYENLLRDRALMVIAHELGHAWHFAVHPQAHEIDEFLVEGFAEWVAFHLMRRTGHTEFSYSIRNNPDPLYGQAFRWFLALEDEHGREAVFQVMRTWTRADGTN